MKILKKLFLATYVLAAMVGICHLNAMDRPPKVVKQKPCASGFQIYLLLSSEQDWSQLGLIQDVIELIKIKVARIIGLLDDFTWNKSGNCYNWENTNSLLNAISRLTDACGQNLATELITICMKDITISAHIINVSRVCLTMNYEHMGGDVQRSQMILMVVGKNNIVELLKGQSEAKQTALHDCVDAITISPKDVMILEAYLKALSQYVQGCPAKSKEVLKLFSMKDKKFRTVLGIAEGEGLFKAAQMLIDVKYELECNLLNASENNALKKKEKCLVQ